MVEEEEIKETGEEKKRRREIRVRRKNDGREGEASHVTDKISLVGRAEEEEKKKKKKRREEREEAERRKRPELGRAWQGLASPFPVRGSVQVPYLAYTTPNQAIDLLRD